MKFSKIHLLVACAASTFITTAAQAQVVLPAAELRGAGATTVGDITVRTLNCVGNPGAGLNQYGTNSPSLATIAPGSYNPTTPSATNPTYDCATQEIQPNFEGKYIGTGSGAGRQMWRTFTTNPPLTGVAGQTNPFGTWSNLQFAFSEAPASASDITAYNTNANSATNKAGAAIQVPFFVVPISFAYNPVYGVKTTAAGPVNLTFNVKVPGTINGTVAGGLRLNRAAYCKIFNGEILNWNDAALKTLNSNVSLMSANDDAARWASEGAPIRLVGRADRSGGTDVFTRALSAQCNGLVTVNKFVQPAELLPYDNTSAIDITRLRGDTRYKPGQANSNFSGTVQSLGGLVYDRATDVICLWNEVNASTTKCDATLAPAGTFTNTPTPGLFMVADGSSGVEEAIRTTVNNTLLTSTVDANVKLNGKFGYVGADWIAPVPGRSLHAAALPKGTTTTYLMPSAVNAAAAFGTILVPQAIATSGAYNIADTRQLGAVDPYKAITDAVNGGASVPVDRANPLHWSAIMYNPNPGQANLANPAAGYPVTGAAFLLTYTCFKPANPLVPGNNANRFAMAEYVGLMFGKITKNSTNTAVSANTFKGTGTTSLGILAKSNIALPAAGWQTAIWETFFRNSTQDGDATAAVAKLGARNLWIQDNAPTTALDVDGIQQATDQKSNPGCDVNLGA